MRDMAQLRLQDEVSRLEGSLTGSTADDPGSSWPLRTPLPPYVVPDGLTLCDHLGVVKQLAATARFILIIPVDGALTTCGRFRFRSRSVSSYRRTVMR